jgi:hypothetical protein
MGTRGTIWPRPYKIVEGEDGKKRRAPERASTWTWQFKDKRGETRSKGGYRTKGDAQAALTEALEQHGKPGTVEPSKMTVAEFLRNEWLPAVRRTKKQSPAIACTGCSRSPLSRACAAANCSR